tara:strand:- start:10 stop:291 length:282 start_codon:yes stop_codon:yes gene_type:complete
MEMTVEKVLEIADDSVALINDVNTKNALSEYLPNNLNQAEVNKIIQKHTSHLEIILTYDGSNDAKPDVAGSSADKSSYTAAITTGKNYITANS